MIKILPSGTSGIIEHGLKPVRSSRIRGRFGNTAKEQTFRFDPLTLHARWKSNRIETGLVFESEIYLRSIALDFRFRSPRHSGDTTVWTESIRDSIRHGNLKTIPGTFSQKTRRDGSWAIWIAEAADTEGLFLRQSPPGDYPIRFFCNPLSRVLKITWEINRMFSEGDTLTLPHVGISQGRMDRLLPSWQREWKQTSRRELLQDRRTGWCGGKEIEAPKDLREVLTSFRSRKIKTDWYALGPDYVSEIGDWLFPSDNFKDRMGSLSRTIAEHNIIPGLRFAPFLVSKKSRIAIEKRDWLVKNAKGNPLSLPGYNGGKESLHVLDLSLPAVIKHVAHTFAVMKDQWGFRAYHLERLGDAGIPGMRSDNRLNENQLISTAGTAIREALGNRVLIISSGLPLLTSPDIWDARVISPQTDGSAAYTRRKRKNIFASAVSTMIHRSFWNESSWINTSGILPLDIFSPENNQISRTLRTAVVLSCGMISLSGDPRNMDGETRDTLKDFLELFQDCRKGRLSTIPGLGGGNHQPLIVRNDSGWIGLFNLSNRKKEVLLDREELKTGLGVSSNLSAGDDTVFNSPEIHVALPPMGCRLFRG